VLPRSFDEQWRVDPERARALIDEETDVVLITEPHNPSGLFSPRDNLLILADICRDKGAYLLINEVYLGYSTRKSFHNLAGNVLIVNSYSKLLGSYSNRIGWVSGSKETVGRLRQANLNMGGGSVPSAAVGIGFAKQAVRRTQMARDASAKWVDVVDDWVKHNPDLQWFRPEGPGFGAVSLPRGIDDLAFVNHLYEQKNVLAIPGSLFFSPGTIRVSWLNVGDRLEEGLDSITATLKERS
jgi:aspartate/methionine/tyrosine aminotransferase